jgi:hypothetical protein
MSTSLLLSIEKLIENHIETTLREVWEDPDVTRISFPILWGDTPKTMVKAFGDAAEGIEFDDTTIFLLLCPNGDGPVAIRSISLSDELNFWLDECASDGSWKDGLTKLAAGFRDLADKIDEAIKQHEEKISP